MVNWFLGFKQNKASVLLPVIIIGFILSLWIVLPKHSSFAGQTKKSYHSYEQRLIDSVKKFELANGLRLITVIRKKSPTISAYIRFKVGSVDEDYTTAGTAHLLEHMLFKGTDRIGTTNWAMESKLREQIDELGRARDFARQQNMSQELIDYFTKKMAQLQKQVIQYVIKDPYDAIYSRHGSKGFNASTSVDITTYKVSLPKNRLELWAFVESERLRQPVLREYYSERDVVIEERRMRIDTKGAGMLYENFIATAFQAHPYRHPIIGWESNIHFLSKEKTEQFFRTYYVPNNMVITIVGDIDPDQTFQIVQKYFGRLKRGPIMPRTNIVEPPQKGERRVLVHHKDSPQLFIGYHKPAMPHRHDYVFDMIQSLLASGRTSRLYRALVLEQKIASRVYAYGALPGSRYNNLFTIVAAPKAPHTNADLEESIDKVLADFISQPVSQKELTKVKNKMVADFIRGLASNTSLASSLSYYEIMTSDWKYLLDYRKNIESITPREIQEVARQYLTKRNRTVAFLNQIK